MYIIGLTGNIGTGKSTVGRMLADLGARYIDADEAAHQVTTKGGPAYNAVVAEFGPQILAADGQIDRRILGQIVFSDAARLRRLEQIVHPAVLARVGSLVEAAKEPVVVLDAIKLIESGMANACDALWVVTCPQEQQVERLMRTRGMSRQEALLRIQAQPPQEDKIRVADVVIDNGGNVTETRRQVKEAWDQIRNPQSAIQNHPGGNS